MHNAIEIRDLRYAYPDDQAAEHVVFEDLNLDIRQGSFVAVLGHNGCGKSTLAKHLNAILLPEAARGNCGRSCDAAQDHCAR